MPGGIQIFFMVSSFFFFFFRWLNLLSFDVVLIALAWQEVFARTAAVTLKWEERVILAIGIWIVYIIDHWLDSVTETFSTTVFLSNKAPRHQYVRSHRSLLGSLLVLASLVNICLLPHLSKNLIIAGSLLACATTGYLLLNHFFLRRGDWFKGREMIISIIFAIGCSLVAVVKSYQPWGLLLWIIVFAVVAFINCVLIARMERKVSIYELGLRWNFSPRMILGFSLAMMLLSFFSPAIARALCWSALGLATIPIVARRFGYEVASLAADQILFFAALLSLLG